MYSLPNARQSSKPIKLVQVVAFLSVGLCAPAWKGVPSHFLRLVRNCVRNCFLGEGIIKSMAVFEEYLFEVPTEEWYPDKFRLSPSVWTEKVNQAFSDTTTPWQGSIFSYGSSSPYIKIQTPDFTIEIAQAAGWGFEFWRTKLYDDDGEMILDRWNPCLGMQGEGFHGSASYAPKNCVCPLGVFLNYSTLVITPNLIIHKQGNLVVVIWIEKEFNYSMPASCVRYRAGYQGVLFDREKRVTICILPQLTHIPKGLNHKDMIFTSFLLAHGYKENDQEYYYPFLQIPDIYLLTGVYRPELMGRKVSLGGEEFRLMGVNLIRDYPYFKQTLAVRIG